MAKIIFIIGGVRSGKSDYAQQLAESLSGPHGYLATCTAGDDELAVRIKKHQEKRNKKIWSTIEEPIELAGTLGNCEKYQTVLVDCLTLWVCNLMFSPEYETTPMSEDNLIERCAEVVEAAANFDGTVIFVTSETGMGIVPDNAISRLYRDLLGICNQEIARAADSVKLIVAGLPVKLK